MNLTFLGAAHEVTGSCFLLQACGKRILIDCGSEQGRDIYENPDLPVAPGMIDAVLLTHAHIDHSGRIPLLVKQGYRGPIYSTDATYDLCGIMLLDSAHIAESEAEWKNRKSKRSGSNQIAPLYTVEDAQSALNQFQPVAYETDKEIFGGIIIRFTDVGHLLGSSSITITVTENQDTKKIVFSGDIGNLDMPIIKDPKYLTNADYVVMESTYGDRTHGERPDTVVELAKIIQRTFDRGGNVVVPCFAVGRTQEMLYYLRQVKERDLVKNHGVWPVYMDSPLAVSATQIVNENYAECFDEEAMTLVKSGINPLSFPGLELAVSSEESKLLNTDPIPKVILSASGMCEAGRIRHHLKHNLWRPESTILFVGYQTEGTLGRILVDGAKNVKLFNETIEVNAELIVLPGMSGHADDQGLLRWAGAFNPKPKKVFVVHGQDTVTDLFAARLSDELGMDAVAPYPGAVFDFNLDTFTEEGIQERIDKVRETEGGKRQSALYDRLVVNMERLSKIVESSSGLSNRELQSMVDSLDTLCQKWKIEKE